MTTLRLMTMSLQEIYDRAVAGLAGQGFEPSVSKNGHLCRYRGEDGRKCAAGHVIDDDEYIQEMEGTNIMGLVSSNNPADSERMALLNSLQNAHDVPAGGGYEDVPREIKRRLASVGQRWALVIPEVLK